jgi:hypothetical protein
VLLYRAVFFRHAPTRKGPPAFTSPISRRTGFTSHKH